ncbi:MAG: BREX-3 system P-loop-containing protein BrxF [Chloroflexota bacterium]
MQDAIAHFLRSPGYQPCLLVVSEDISRLDRASAGLSTEYGWPRLSIGRELSAVLISEPSQRRGPAAQNAFESMLATMTPGPVSCTEIGLLFEPQLTLDPLALLRQSSRVAPLVVAWPGSYADGVLAYAVPAHAHYRTWSWPEVQIFSLG